MGYGKSDYARLKAMRLGNRIGNVAMGRLPIPQSVANIINLTADHWSADLLSPKVRFWHTADFIRTPGVKDSILDQARRMQLGVRRLTYYSSCFTDNYRDVCTAQKTEDVRFMEGLTQLVKQHNIVTRMFKIYVNQLLQGLTPERIRHIQMILIGKGATIASGSMTNQALAYAIVAAVSYSFGIRVGANTKLAK
jgi:hypothetical protein